jgi:hypothetical protein
VTDDGTLQLAYFLSEADSVPHTGSSTAAQDPIAVITFRHKRAVLFGAPNDESLAGHPLASRGLQHYVAAEVLGSSWVRSLEHMNRVHPRHSLALFEGLRHFIFPFHDSTFECLAEGYSIKTITGTMEGALAEMSAAL